MLNYYDYKHMVMPSYSSHEISEEDFRKSTFLYVSLKSKQTNKRHKKTQTKTKKLNKTPPTHTHKNNTKQKQKKAHHTTHQQPTKHLWRDICRTLLQQMTPQGILASVEGLKSDAFV